MTQQNPSRCDDRQGLARSRRVRCGLPSCGRTAVGGVREQPAVFFKGEDGDIAEDVVVCGGPHHGLRGVVEAE
jgi:hypothetical protein